MPDAYQNWIEGLEDDGSTSWDETSNLTWGPVPSYLYGSEVPTPFAPGEDIGIRELPNYSLPTIPVGQSGLSAAARNAAIYATGAVLSAVAGASDGGGGYAPLVDPYPDYEGEVTPESHPELFEPPPHIPTPREVYESNTPHVVLDENPPILIPIDATGGSELEPGEENMPTFWDVASGFVDVIQGQQVGGGPVVASQPPVTQLPSPVSVPSIPSTGGATSNLRWDARSGRWVCKRRRRRRLLTESDFNDLMRIATLPNKQNVTVALAKAVGRR